MPLIPAPTAALNWYARFHAVDRAIAQRYHALGLFRWPIHSHDWDRDVVQIGDVTETTLSTTHTWDTTKDNPWDHVNKTAHDEVRVPSSWILVFDDCSNEAVVITKITGITDAGELTFENIRDYVTAGIIPSVESLEGRWWGIINGDYGVWWSERIYPWPNVREHARGTVIEYFDNPDDPLEVTNPTDHSIKDDRPEWRASEVTGKDLLLYATDGDGTLLRRVTVTAADDETRIISFAAQSWTPDVDSPYCVVETGGRAIPGRERVGDLQVGQVNFGLSDPPSPYEHYYGIRKGYFTHAPVAGGGTYVNSIPKSAPTFRLPGIGAGSCEGTLVGAWYVDLWESFPLDLADADCSDAKAEYPHTPRLFWTWGGRQAALEGVMNYRGASNGVGFVEDKNYDTELRVPIRGAAMTFKEADINWLSTTTTTVTVTGMAVTSNVINFSSASFPAGTTYPIEVHFCVLRANGEYNFGFGVATSATSITGDDAAPDIFAVAQDEGREIIISLGWTRFTERRFRRMFPVTFFLPDTHEVDGEQEAIDGPPEIVDFAETECLGAGKWVRRPRSNCCLTADLNQSADADRGNKGRIEDDPQQPFADGLLYRYVGDNHQDPTVEDQGRQMVDAVDPQVAYFDHTFIGRHPAPVQARIDEQLIGRATGGSTFRLEDPSKDWLEPQWYSGGVLRTESGTATGGSTTSLTDSTKTTGEANCWWDADRFIGWNGSGYAAGADGCDPYCRFTVEVLISGTDFDDPDAVIEARFITSGNDTGVTIGWGEPLSASASGKQYRIREPRYGLNRYEGRGLRMTRPDPGTPGTWQTQTVKLLGNHQTTLFFATEADWAPDADTIYEIEDPAVGTVWKWNEDDTEFVKPVGADVARLGNADTPADFHPNQLENLPTIVKRYGRWLPGDIPCRKLFDEVIAVLNVMTCTRQYADWTSNGSPNHRTGSGGNDEVWGSLGNDFGDAVDAYNANYAGNSDNEEDGQPPRAYSIGRHSLVTGEAMWINGERRIAYGTTEVTQPFCPINNKIKWYALAWLDDANHDEGGDCYDDGSGRHNWLEYHFHANGDNVLWRQMKSYDAESTSGMGQTRTSAVSLGASTASAPIVDEPSPGGCFTPTTDGGATDDYFMAASGGYVIPPDPEASIAVICWEFEDLTE